MDDDDDSDDEEITAEKFQHNGKDYLKTQDNILYDCNTHEPVGEWDEDAEQIVEYAESDDDEE